ncbi:MAG: amino acid adenylation domain-containing protein, partial [Pseudoclavibacter sp.]|nr:amino acid adenylation domain-containing protein [Pseudoclavibacter sp.]
MGGRFEPPQRDDPLDASGRAAPARTLIEVLRETARRHPAAAAIADGAGELDYRGLLAETERLAARLRAAGVRRGDRVGVRMPSGGRDLYLAILSVLAAGAAYVPVDVDDPPERARLVFAEAGVRGVVGEDGRFAPGAAASAAASARVDDESGPTPGDDAWIIFTSGSTGTPKGVAVTHRSAAAFVDAEAELFLRERPLGPGDRVLAGLSVAFDASCEEMWLAWRSGACLVPAPRELVRSGMDLGPWLLERGITVVSTVPTLAALWPARMLREVRLLIFGGEAVPPELAARLADGRRELWNTYGPTEATVVACAARLDGAGPVRIGLPLPGWRLWVVDPEGRPVAEGEQGELVIGGVGLARYLDPAKDAEKYAAMPGLGQERVYRSGDLVRLDPEGLVFLGRADDQVKIGGRRIELGEVEAALLDLPGVSAASAAVRRTAAGVQVLVGYLAVAEPAGFDRAGALARLRERLPGPLVPLLAVLAELPVRVSGKVDRDALPWPVADAEGDPAPELTPAEARLAAMWQEVLGVPVRGRRDDFFDLGGGSLAAAQLVSAVRAAAPGFTVAEVYDSPRLADMAAGLPMLADDDGAPAAQRAPQVAPLPLRARVLQTLLSVPLLGLAGARWLVWLLLAAGLLRLSGGFEALPTVHPGLLAAGLLLFGTPFGRMAISVLAARCLLAGLRPGDYPRGGGVHLRLWLTEQIAAQIGAVSLAGAPWVSWYARALGARIGRGATLHALPPVTGMLELGAEAAVEPEVDLSGAWIDGDIVRIGPVRIGARSRVGARSTLLPGARIGRDAELAPGSAVFGKVPAGQRWAGSPAVRTGTPRRWWPAERAPRGRRWSIAYGLGSLLISLLPPLALGVGAVPALLAMRGARGLGEALLAGLPWIVPGTALAGLVLAGGVLGLVRLLSIGLRAGVHPVRGAAGWRAWSIERLLDLARTILFPIYSSAFTPVWLRLLGARVGRGVEVSTVLLLPSFTTIRDGAFLADDTMVASYELGAGWVRLAPARIGRRAFLGNSGMAPSGLKVPRDALVAVLSTAPRKAKAGSSWLGSPAVRMRRRRNEGDPSRTYEPGRRLRLARAMWE